MTPQALADIHTVVVHCSATPAGMFIDAAWIDQEHRKRGWSMIGYHEVVLLDGERQAGREWTRRGAHVAGENVNTLGFCMVGGLDDAGRPADTYFQEQWWTLYSLLHEASRRLPGLKRICGHRDFSPDLNHNGLIEPAEWIKACPCFDVARRLSRWGLARYALPGYLKAGESM